MAKSIASLFGPSAEEIVYDRNQAERIRQQAQLQQSLAGQENRASRDFYESGYNMATGAGRGLAGLFGYSEQIEDPRIAKSLKLRQILGNTGVDDLNDETKLAALSASLEKEGLTQEALYFADREKEVKKYNLDLATALDPVLTEGVVTKDGRVVGRNKYNQYFTLDDMKRVDQGSLQSVRLYEKQISAGADEPAVASIVAIENSFLADTDFDKQTKDRVAKYLNQKAELIVREPGFDTKEQALDEAYKRAIKEGVIVNDARTIFNFRGEPVVTTESLGGLAGLGRKDWKFRPEGTGTVLKPGFRIVAED